MTARPEIDPRDPDYMAMSHVPQTSPPAAISGTFSDYRYVKTRSVLQIVIEVAVERTADVFAALGYPQPGTEIHVAVARLNSEVAERTIAEVAPHPRILEPPGVAGSNPALAANTPPSSQTLGAGAQGSSATGGPGGTVPSPAFPSPVAPEGDENRGARAVKRAGILCKDPEFQVFAGTTWSAARANPVACEIHAAGFLRTRCQIASRKHLAHDEAARERFRALVTEYDLWRGRIPEMRG